MLFWVQGAADGDNDSVQQCWAEAEKSWDALMSILHLSADQLCMLCHRVLDVLGRLPPQDLSSAPGRRAAEAAFIAHIEPLIASLPATLDESARLFGTGEGGDAAGQEMLQQLAVESPSGGQANGVPPLFRPRLMRLVKFPALADMDVAFRTRVNADPSQLRLMKWSLSPTTTENMVRGPPMLRLCSGQHAFARP